MIHVPHAEWPVFVLVAVATTVEYVALIGFRARWHDVGLDVPPDPSVNLLPPGLLEALIAARRPVVPAAEAEKYLVCAACGTPLLKTTIAAEGKAEPGNVYKARGSGRRVRYRCPTCRSVGRYVI